MAHLGPPWLSHPAPGPSAYSWEGGRRPRAGCDERPEDGGRDPTPRQAFLAELRKKWYRQSSLGPDAGDFALCSSLRTPRLRNNRDPHIVWLLDTP